MPDTTIHSLDDNQLFPSHGPVLAEGRRKALHGKITTGLLSGGSCLLPRNCDKLRLHVESVSEFSIIGRIDCENGKRTTIVSFAVCGRVDDASPLWARLPASRNETSDCAEPPGTARWVACTDHVTLASPHWGRVLINARRHVAELAYAWLHDTSPRGDLSMLTTSTP